MTHGSKSHRALGSIGAGTTPGHVYKGKKMPGRMGGTKTKIRKLKIVKIDNDLRVVMIKGAVPGRYVVGNLLQFSWGECMTPGSVRETLQSNGRLE
ncbi:50S ribosomal protein L3, chloroplastic [Vitis vinifera]|uniref:Large ribosomal subunit protein uL3c n=1 Tax=Vitis vinifera TaxID=29760 RepID=A0A438CCB2_VITVI|nr:50S ribosomal protein L3, chloroplastic [Vitis vinifera]